MSGLKPKPERHIWYDYDVQAWIVDGLVDRCGHRTKAVGCTACRYAGLEARVVRRKLLAK